MAALSRATAGSIGSTLVINLPGSTKGAVEGLEQSSESSRTPSICSPATPSTV